MTMFGAGAKATCLYCGKLTGTYIEPAPGDTFCNWTCQRNHKNSKPRFDFAGTQTGRWSSNDTFEWKAKPETAKPEVSKMAQNSEFSLLIKLLGMTTSSNNVEALAFMRKANEQLRKMGWTWEKLLTQKVTIVEDPFQDAPVLAKAEAEKEIERLKHALSVQSSESTYWRDKAHDFERKLIKSRARAEIKQPESGSNWNEYNWDQGTTVSGPPRPRRQPTRKGKGSADGMTLKDLGL